MKRLVFVLILFLLSPAVAQETAVSRIDSLFMNDSGNRPGYAIGVVKDGELIFSKGYGMANLEYDIPISDSTVFYIGSVGKQFTAASILQLESKGLLDRKDEVRKYLPNFPVYKDPILIEHLIHHTGGIRGTNSLQLIQGIDPYFEEYFNTSDLAELIYQQEELNFRPGNEYRYSSGGYAVLARIVEQVSGMGFREYLNEHIFEPLGMENTFVADNRHEVVAKRADSYWPVDSGGFEQRNLIFEAYGDGGIMTTVRDMAKWDKAFYSDILGINDFAAKMYTQGILNNGELIPYAFALEIHQFNGRRTVLHGGGMLGYRADIVRFPDDRLSVIALSNNAYADPIGKAFEVASLFLENSESNHNMSGHTTEAIQEEMFDVLAEDWEGKYFSEEINQWRRLSFSGDSLFFDSGDLTYRSYLVPLGDSLFWPQGYEADARVRLFEQQGVKRVEFSTPTVERNYVAFDDTLPVSLDELKPLAGSYYSSELNSWYHFNTEGESFYLQINNREKIELYPNPKDPRINWNSKDRVWIGFAMIHFIKDQSGRNSVIKVGDYRVSGLYFQKREIYSPKN